MILEEASGLADCIHKGPSTVNSKTLRNNPHLPRAFLRGCGLNERESEAPASDIPT